jgi:hypothetical protein
MTQTHRWIKTTGGPHLLIAEELLPFWRGIEGWHDHLDPIDQSDYARACRIETWIGAIPCLDGTAVVLSGDAGDITWIPAPSGDNGFLVQWVGVEDENLIEPALRSRAILEAFNSSNAETLVFDTGPSGMMRLVDAAEHGTYQKTNDGILMLKPGQYQMRAGYFEAPGIMIVVRKIRRL